MSLQLLVVEDKAHLNCGISTGWMKFFVLGRSHLVFSHRKVHLQLHFFQQAEWYCHLWSL